MAKSVQNIIHSDPDILGGTPVFVGTRVPVKNLWDYLEAGDPLDRFIEHFPSVSREQAVAAIELGLAESSPSLRVDRTAVSISSLDDPPDDVQHWRGRSIVERLQGIEYLRWMNHGSTAVSTRLQRVLEVAQRA